MSSKVLFAEAKKGTEEQMSLPYNLCGTKRSWAEVEKRENPRVESKFSMMLQMVFGHQMQMGALQLANPQLSCQKHCHHQALPPLLPLLLLDVQKNGSMGKGTTGGTAAKHLQAVSLNSIYPSENKTSTN